MVGFWTTRAELKTAELWSYILICMKNETSERNITYRDYYTIELWNVECLLLFSESVCVWKTIYNMWNCNLLFQNQHCILNIHLEAVERLHHNQVTYKSKMVKNRSKITLSETWANNLTSDCYLSKTRWLANNSCMNRWQIDGQNLAGAWFKLT